MGKVKNCKIELCYACCNVLLCKVCNRLRGVKLSAANNMQLSKQTRPACPSPKHQFSDLTLTTTLMMMMMTMMKMTVMTQFIADDRGGGSNN